MEKEPIVEKAPVMEEAEKEKTPVRSLLFQPPPVKKPLEKSKSKLNKFISDELKKSTLNTKKTKEEFQPPHNH